LYAGAARWIAGGKAQYDSRQRRLLGGGLHGVVNDGEAGARVGGAVIFGGFYLKNDLENDDDG